MLVGTQPSMDKKPEDSNNDVGQDKIVKRTAVEDFKHLPAKKRFLAQYFSKNEPNLVKVLTDVKTESGVEESATSSKTGEEAVKSDQETTSSNNSSPNGTTSNSTKAVLSTTIASTGETEVVKANTTGNSGKESAGSQQASPSSASSGQFSDNKNAGGNGVVVAGSQVNPVQVKSEVIVPTTLPVIEAKEVSSNSSNNMNAAIRAAAKPPMVVSPHAVIRNAKVVQGIKVISNSPSPPTARYAHMQSVKVNGQKATLVTIPTTSHVRQVTPVVINQQKQQTLSTSARTTPRDKNFHHQHHQFMRNSNTLTVSPVSLAVPAPSAATQSNQYRVTHLTPPGKQVSSSTTSTGNTATATAVSQATATATNADIQHAILMLQQQAQQEYQRQQEQQQKQALQQMLQNQLLNQVQMFDSSNSWQQLGQLLATQYQMQNQTTQTYQAAALAQQVAQANNQAATTTQKSSQLPTTSSNLIGNYTTTNLLANTQRNLQQYQIFQTNGLKSTRISPPKNTTKTLTPDKNISAATNATLSNTRVSESSNADQLTSPISTAKSRRPSSDNDSQQQQQQHPLNSLRQLTENQNPMTIKPVQPQAVASVAELTTVSSTPTKQQPATIVIAPQVPSLPKPIISPVPPVPAIKKNNNHPEPPLTAQPTVPEKASSKIVFTDTSEESKEKTSTKESKLTESKKATKKSGGPGKAKRKSAPAESCSSDGAQGKASPVKKKKRHNSTSDKNKGEMWTKQARVETNDGRTDYKIDPDDESYNSVTCSCGKPFAGRLMVECERCEIWYHADCVGLTDDTIPDKFTCEKNTACREFGKSKQNAATTKKSRKGGRKK